MAKIRLDHLGKRYANGQLAVQDLTLEVAEGEFLVLVGPSGCGKTTTLRLLAGLETPTAGKIFLDDKDVTAQPPQKRDLAMVFQNYALYPHMTVRGNLEFALRLQRMPKHIIKERVAKVAENLGLTTLLESKPARLSGGERQRVALGRAIVREPKAFLLDEPLSNLDARLRVQARAELAHLHRQLGATVLHVTHDQEEAMTLGDRVAVLRDGRLQQIAAPMEIYHRPRNVFVASFIGSPAMNFFTCQCERQADGIVLRSPHFQIPIQEKLTGRNEVLLGIRPQDIEIVDAGAVDASARVDVVQPLGSDTLVYTSLEGDKDAPSLAVMAPADMKLRNGDTVSLRFPRARLHLFDRESEERIVSGQTSPHQ